MFFSRREFLIASSGFLFVPARKKGLIQTVSGTISSKRLGKTLIHEHFLVDFIGADRITPDRWNRDRVVKKVLPYLKEAQQAGIKSIFDCTPNFLGRDVQLIKLLADESGVHIITNTGYYGAVQNKYLPPWAFTETAEQLAQRWISEFEEGIDSTPVKPGFIKIGVDSASPLSDLHKKLALAAALTHRQTGLTICSHTGPAAGAFEQLEIIQHAGVRPEAFVWVHAQAEADKQQLVIAAKQGCWVSLDGIGWGDFDQYADSIALLKAAGLLNRVLISHDAGWFEPDEPEAEFKGYVNIFKELFPRLIRKGFDESDFDQLLLTNPAEAMSIRIRRM
jgi:phosphotriesterase-related protein